MKKISVCITSAVLLFGLGAVHAEPIGKVLVAVGDTAALRNGVVVGLKRGDEVHRGDTLRVGDASNMQVRFSDEGITALRSNSEFRIDDYKFESGTNVGKSFFSLLKGGMRTITGLIGRFNRDNYAVKAQTATIGIRGTHFVLAQCNNDCFNRDGSQAENGLFGGVTDGRIAVDNQAGSLEFGRNEFFHVPSADMLPKPLLAPPSFLRDQLEGQAQSQKGKTTLATAVDSTDGGAEGSETAAGSTGQQTNTAVTTQPSDGAPVVVQTEVVYQPVDQTAVQTNVSGGLINSVVVGQAYPYQISMANAWAGTNTYTYTDLGQVFSGTMLFGYSDSWMDQGSLTILDPTKLVQADQAMFADFVINQTPVTTFLLNAYSLSGTSDYFNYPVDCFDITCASLAGTVNFNWSKTVSTNLGSNAVANLSWGRFTRSTSGTVLTGAYAGNTYNETSYEHWATGDLLNVAALPTTGMYTYSHVGGTRPTDQNGNMGTVISGGVVGIDFGQGMVSIVGASWSMPSGNTYSLNVYGAQAGLTQQPYSYSNSGWTDTGTSTYITPINTSASCSGTCGSAVAVPTVVSPMLFGASAEGLAAGIHTNLPQGASPAEITASVQVYTKDATPNPQLLPQ